MDNVGQFVCVCRSGVRIRVRELKAESFEVNPEVKLRLRSGSIEAAQEEGLSKSVAELFCCVILLSLSALQRHRIGSPILADTHKH